MIKNSVVLVAFPFDDFTNSKVRPAICLTSEIGEFNHVIIAFITSKISEVIMNSDLVFTKQSNFFSGTGLLIDSTIRLHKMVTIPKIHIKRKPGKINKTLDLNLIEN